MRCRPLAHIVRQHEVLERYLGQRAEEASGSYKQALDTLLASRSAGFRPAPDRDGDFSGTIAMLKLPGISLRPGGSAPGATALSGEMPQVRRGDTIGVTVLFSGMGLQKDLSADVSYDIKVTRPDGLGRSPFGAAGVRRSGQGWRPIQPGRQPLDSFHSVRNGRQAGALSHRCPARGQGVGDARSR